MPISVIDFKGEIPRRAPHLLPTPCAQLAINCRMLDGDLRPLNGALQSQNFPGGGFNSIFWLNRQYWLRWPQVVDVARSSILGDVTGRIIFTGTDVPRITNIQLATASVSDISKTSFVIGPTESITVRNGSQFFAGDTIVVSDGVSAISGLVSSIAGNVLSVSTLTVNMGAVGDTMQAIALVTRPNTGTQYPYLSFKLGSPAPLLGPSSVDYDYAQFVIASTDDCSSLAAYSVVGAAELTTATFVIVAAGSTQTVDTQDGSKFINGNSVTIDDGTNKIVGTVTAISGNFINVMNTAIISGSAGATMALGAAITIQGSQTGAIVVDGSVGNPLPSFKATLISDNGMGGFLAGYAAITATRDLAIDLPLTMLTVDIQCGVSGTPTLDQEANIFFGANAEGAGNFFRIYRPLPGMIPGPTSFHLYYGYAKSWSDAAPVSMLAGVITGMSEGVFYRFNFLYMGQTSAGSSYIVRVFDGSTFALIYQTKVSIPVAPSGPYVGFGQRGPKVYPYAWFDNIGAQSFVSAGADKLTNYVITYVTSLGEESAPSPVSPDFITSDQLTKIITLPAVPNTTDQARYGANYIADYDVVGFRLYRDATLTSGSGFFLVADETVLQIGIATYSDTTPDSGLGVALPSEEWALPPADGHSIISLPNGITFLASKNQACLSPIGQPHAYPVLGGYRYPTDTAIVGAGNIDSTLIIQTQGFPYVAYGSDSSAFTMGKLDRSYGCTSKRGIAYLREFGILWPSMDGIMASAGSAPRVLTQAYFTQKDWLEQVNPSTIVATVKDDRYIGFCQPSMGAYKGFIFDPKDQGQGWSWFDLSPLLDWTQTPAEGYFTDDITGDTYMIRGSDLQVFEKGAPLYLTWRSKIFREPYPEAMNVGRIKMLPGYVASATPCLAKYYVDGALLQSKIIANRMPYTLPSASGEDIEFQLEGKWTFQQAEYSEDVENLL